MRDSLHAGWYIVFVALWISCLPVLAASIVILEESFESPVVEGSQQINPPGWVRQVGTDTKLYTALLNQSVGYFSTPYGEQVLSIWSGNTVTTTNITDRLQPGV
ncbi:MAG: hypothetical protein ACNA71_07965, partial [Kiritimatiellia bacterium]